LGWYLGKSHLILGLRGSGKTTVALRQFRRHEYGIIIAPSMSNPELLKYDHIDDSNLLDLQQLVVDRHKFRVDVIEGNEHLFEELSKIHGTENTNLPVLLDDLSAVMSSPKLKEDLVSFTRKLRYHNLDVTMTTHRISGDLPRTVVVLSDTIAWVGPLSNKKEIDLLYEATDIDIEYEPFSERLHNLKKFDYRAPNYTESVYYIKGKSPTEA
jgi:hypothetical protein